MKKTRFILANQAKYNWLLFMDSDVIPKKANYLKKIVNNICLNQNADVIFGGIAYREKPTNPKLLLRWKYGKSKEEQNLANRKKNKYLSLIKGAICIKKNMFFKI